jgi:hypothetical protein
LRISTLYGQRSAITGHSVSGLSFDFFSLRKQGWWALAWLRYAFFFLRNAKLLRNALWFLLNAKHPANRCLRFEKLNATQLRCALRDCVALRKNKKNRKQGGVVMVRITTLNEIRFNCIETTKIKKLCFFLCN